MKYIYYNPMFFLIVSTLKLKNYLHALMQVSIEILKQYFDLPKFFIKAYYTKKSTLQHSFVPH